ncbi:MAG: LytR/AlgR family response regulator transcription factor [Faecalibacillus intestinalis]|jgi:two-component system response regulator LytT|uniref:LytR/AlgR family response regulator transcription factor n=1 Tax=Coprobacillus cateniformis TaxID=100884 RepID=UPI0039A21C90
MIRIAICDDEEIFRYKIEEILKDYFKKRQLVYSVDFFESGIELINNNGIKEYNIIFLDINMEGINGIETAKKIRKISNDVFLVFITAFLDYSLEGYKVHAIRYILKDSGKMPEAINECMDTILQEANKKFLKIRIDFIEGAKVVPIDAIVYVESNLHKLNYYVNTIEGIRDYTQYTTLNKVENNFPKTQFVRIHQSYLVNLKYIKYIKNYKAILKNGLELSIPKSRYKDVCNTFILFKGSL